MNRLAASALIALGLCHSAPAQDPSQPWVVWRETTPVRASADAEAERRGALSHGEEVSGELVLNPRTNEEWLCFEVSGEIRCVTTNDLIRVLPASCVEGDLPIGTEIANRWWGVPPSYEPSDLVPLPRRWRADEDREYPLRREAMEALIEMLEAAERSGIEIRVASGYRSFEHQEGNFRGALRRLGRGQRQVARPGHSEHQLGTTVDLDDSAGEFTLTPAFATTPTWRWLNEHGADFGWRQSYTHDNSPETGYDPEPWHFRYFGRPEVPTAASQASLEALR